MTEVVQAIAAIGLIGIGAQWIAWRTQVPAIVLLLAAGFLAGPVAGLIDPPQTFGDVLLPFVSTAVAIILFEGGLTLNFAEIRETSQTVRRLILIGAPATWGLTFLAAHHLAGLSAPSAAVFSGILVVTGPTVIMPLLRQARLPNRPASLLRWEAIVADPIGALFAVIAYEAVVAFAAGHGLTDTVLRLAMAIVAGGAIAFLSARGIAFAFVRGHVPEFLKSPILLVAVIAAFEITNLILDEAGLLTVTLMGVVLANSRIASLDELRRFKEVITVLLVSGLFVVLTASTSLSSLAGIGMRDALFLAALVFLIRPAVVFAITLGSNLKWPERAICAWIAPRGVVAVAVASLFAEKLGQHGVADAERIGPLAFMVVVATVLMHGFSVRPLANALKVTSNDPLGLLIVGGSEWATALAQKVKELGMPVLIADTNWNHLMPARRAGINVYYGEILSEAAEHFLDLSQYGALIAATDNDAYNALVCSDLGPEMGRSNVFQLGRVRASDSVAGAKRSEHHQLHFTVGGRSLLEGLTIRDLAQRLAQGWTFKATPLSAEFTYQNFVASRGEDVRVLFLLKPKGRLSFVSDGEAVKAAPGDAVVSFGPAAKAAAPAKPS